MTITAHASLRSKEQHYTTKITYPIGHNGDLTCTFSLPKSFVDHINDNGFIFTTMEDIVSFLTDFSWRLEDQKEARMDTASILTHGLRHHAYDSWNIARGPMKTRLHQLKLLGYKLRPNEMLVGLSGHDLKLIDTKKGLIITEREPFRACESFTNQTLMTEDQEVHFIQHKRETDEKIAQTIQNLIDAGNIKVKPAAIAFPTVDEFPGFRLESDSPYTEFDTPPGKRIAALRSLRSKEQHYLMEKDYRIGTGSRLTCTFSLPESFIDYLRDKAPTSILIHEFLSCLTLFTWEFEGPKEAQAETASILIHGVRDHIVSAYLKFEMKTDIFCNFSKLDFLGHTSKDKNEMLVGWNYPDLAFMNIHKKGPLILDSMGSERLPEKFPENIDRLEHEEWTARIVKELIYSEFEENNTEDK